MTTPHDLAQALLRRHRARLAEERARAEQVRAGVERVLGEAGRAGELRRAWLIGSLSHGSFGAGSDVDVVVEGMTADAAAALYGKLVHACRVEADVLRLEELPPSFRERVRSEGVLLHGA